MNPWRRVLMCHVVAARGSSLLHAWLPLARLGWLSVVVGPVDRVMCGSLFTRPRARALCRPRRTAAQLDWPLLFANLLFSTTDGATGRWVFLIFHRGTRSSARRSL